MMRKTVATLRGRREVVFAPSEFSGGHISEDNGQGMVATRTCTMFSCQEWDGPRPVYPVLQGGMSTCPRCGASYGEGNALAFATGKVVA